MIHSVPNEKLSIKFDEFNHFRKLVSWFEAPLYKNTDTCFPIQESKYDYALNYSSYIVRLFHCFMVLFLFICFLSYQENNTF